MIRWTSGLPTSTAPPNAPAVATQGATGAVTWGYRAAAVMPDGDTQLSAQGQATNGVTPLTGSNFQRVTKPTSMPPGAIGWRVVRTQSGGTPAGINVDISGVLALGTATFSDTGIAGTAYTAVTGSRPANPDTRVAEVRLGERMYILPSGEARHVEPGDVAAVTSKLAAAYPAGSVSTPAGSQ